MSSQIRARGSCSGCMCCAEVLMELTLEEPLSFDRSGRGFIADVLAEVGGRGSCGTAQPSLETDVIWR